MKVRRLVLLVIVAALALGVGAVGSSIALFAAHQQVPGTFSTAHIDLTLTPAEAVFSATDMVPGDTVAGSLTVSNSGSMELRYALTSSATDDDDKHLAGVLQLEMRAEGTDCSTFDGATLYEGPLGEAAFGDPATGADDGDRSLATGSAEVLCLRVTLPDDTGNAYQQAATTLTLLFDAEQTDNNP